MHPTPRGRGPHIAIDAEPHGGSATEGNAERADAVRVDLEVADSCRIRHPCDGVLAILDRFAVHNAGSVVDRHHDDSTLGEAVAGGVEVTPASGSGRATVVGDDGWPRPCPWW